MQTPKEFADAILGAFKAHLERALAPFTERLSRLDEQLKSLPQPDVASQVDTAVKAAVAALPKPKDGTSVEIDQVRQLVAEAVGKAVAEIRPGKDGEKGDRGEKGEKGDAAESIDPRAVAAEIQRQLEQVPKPKDGENGKDGKTFTVEEVNALVAEAVKQLPPAKNGENGINGKDGDPGRDAAQIEILPYIDEDRAYARGTYASHQGGIVRAARTTDYLDTLKVGETIETKGWQIVWKGVHEHTIEQKDERTFVIRSVMTGGQVVEKTVSVPAVLDRGVFRAGEKYAKGDAVTYGGSLWIGQQDDPPGKPGDVASGWRLSVKRGQDGKSANAAR